MRVVVDFDLCESNAVCMGVAPEVFEVRDDDFLYVLQEEPDESLRAKVEEAAARCPKQAISIAEERFPTSQDALDLEAPVQGSTTLQHTIDELEAGTHYFAVAAVSVNGAEGARSEILIKTVM